MNASRGRPPKDRIKHPRQVAEGVGRSLRERMPPPEKPYGEEMVEEVHEFMRSHLDGPCDLGLYNEAEDRAMGHGPATLGGHAQTIRFPKFWHVWFSKQTEARLSTIDEIVDERMEREVLRRAFRRLKHATVWAFGAAVVGAHWFSDQIAWFMEKLPVLREFWKLITGAGKP